MLTFLSYIVSYYHMKNNELQSDTYLSGCHTVFVLLPQRAFSVQTEAFPLSRMLFLFKVGAPIIISANQSAILRT